jgi:hypothetical protein
MADRRSGKSLEVEIILGGLADGSPSWDVAWTPARCANTDFTPQGEVTEEFRTDGRCDDLEGSMPIKVRYTVNASFGVPSAGPLIGYDKTGHYFGVRWRYVGGSTWSYLVGWLRSVSDPMPENGAMSETVTMAVQALTNTPGVTA